MTKNLNTSSKDEFEPYRHLRESKTRKNLESAYNIVYKDVEKAAQTLKA